MGKVYFKPKLEISYCKIEDILTASAEVDSDGIGFDFTSIWGGNEV